MTWRAARSLTTLHKQLQRGAPRAAPPATGADEWGLIGDAAHDPTSDHTPRNFSGWGNEIVTAADFPNRPDLGLDAHAVLDDIRRSRDNRVKYGISNGQMFSSYAVTGYGPWEWRPYNPKNGDKHFTHGHLSVVGDARADDPRPWETIGAPRAAGEDDDMGGYGPVAMRADEERLTLTIPPVGGTEAVPGPANVWLNFGVDFDPSRWRVWVGNGAGSAVPIPGSAAAGVVELEGFHLFSGKLPVGTRMISVVRLPLADGPAYGGPVVFNFETS